MAPTVCGYPELSRALRRLRLGKLFRSGEAARRTPRAREDRVALSSAGRPVDGVAPGIIWTEASRHVDYAALLPTQLSNHFPGNGALTTKDGLSRTLAAMMWQVDATPDTFFPRCYDVADAASRVDFEEEFVLSAAQAVLSRAAEDMPARLVHCAVEAVALLRAEADYLVSTLAAPRVDRSQWADPIMGVFHQLLIPRVPGFMAPRLLGSDTCRGSARHDTFMHSAHAPRDPHDLLAAVADPDTPPPAAQIDDARAWLHRRPQCANAGPHNAWIVKPADRNQGKGIAVFTALEDIRRATRGAEGGWVCQRYIERPLLIEGRKFDLRQWVLVVGGRGGYVQWLCLLYILQNKKKN
jgi:tubulin monoglycylase TTLL3/8